MGTVILVLILLGVLLALVAAVRAVRAYLAFRRARAELQGTLNREVSHLALRTGTLEKNLAAVDARAQQLPVRLAELQENLATLRILTGALSTSVRQVQRLLSYAELKTLSATRLSRLLDLWSARVGPRDARTGQERDG